MRQLFILGLVCFSLMVVAQPANDICNNAISLGTLPLGAGTCRTGDNTNANPEFPYPFQSGCSGSLFQDWPAADVWYTFTTPLLANEVQIQISGDIVNPNVAIYGGSCGGLIGIGCGSYNSFGTFRVAPVTAGRVYYVQVSGGNETDVGEFQICLTATDNPNICVAATNFTVNPAPNNGYYSPGQTVNFCFAVTEFVQRSTNWFHGITISPGAGYTPGSLTPVSTPASCDGNGDWAFYNTITSSATGTSAGTGFYYDSGLGGPLDGDPGNNYGDNCTNNTWNFCWSLQIPSYPTVAACLNASQDLGITIETWGDGEIGSWSSFSCQADPLVNFSAVLQCCPLPITSSTPPGCGGTCTGTATAIGTGVDPHTYTWDNGQTGSTITGLCSGNYNVTVVDQNNCESYATVTVGASTPLTLNGSSTNVTCFGANNGGAIVTTIGGVAPFNFAWNNSISINNDTLSNLGLGSYSVIVTDASGCTATRSYTITEPTQLIVSLVDSQSVSCFGAADGAIDINATGGQPNYVYSWSNGAATQDLVGIIGGNYIVTVSDAANCRDTFSITITDANQVSIISTVDSISCAGQNDGKINIDVSGGASGSSVGFTFLWGNGNTTDSLTNLGIGNYSVTISDANACSIALSFSLGTPSLISPTYTIDSLGCNLFNVDINVVGGTSPYSFIWSTGDSTEDIGPVVANNYQLTITDVNGCSISSSVDVINNNPSTILNISFLATNESCFGLSDGAIDAAIVGGALPNTFLWNNNSTSEDLTGITSGTYILTVTDANGCFDIDSVNITAAQAINSIAIADSVSCFGEATGRIILNVSGGAAPLNFLWNTGATTADLDSVQAGNYTVVIADANGCIDSLSITVDQFPLLEVAVTIQDNICFNYNDGSATINVIGGLPSYNIEWSNGNVTNQILNLRFGDYAVSVTDANGCDTVANFTVVRADTIGLQLPDTVSIDFTDSIELALEYLIQDNDSVSFSWSPTNELTCSDCSNPIAFPYLSGDYIVTMSVDGCVYKDTVFIKVGPPSIYMPNAFSPNNDGTNDLFLPITFGSKEFMFRVFDRWGEKIFESNDIKNGWNGLYDGKQLPPSTYIYFVYIKFLDDSEKYLKGSITLIK